MEKANVCFIGRASALEKSAEEARKRGASVAAAFSGESDFDGATSISGELCEAELDELIDRFGEVVVLDSSLGLSELDYVATAVKRLGARLILACVPTFSFPERVASTAWATVVTGGGAEELSGLKLGGDVANALVVSALEKLGFSRFVIFGKQVIVADGKNIDYVESGGAVEIERFIGGAAALAVRGESFNDIAVAVLGEKTL